VRTELVGDDSRPLLISVGRLTPQKGGSDLLTAFAHVCETHPEAALIIVGDGSDLETLAEQIKALGLTNHAWLLGARSDVPRLLAASDLYVSASLFEGLPVAMLEAMAAGLPVAATDAGDVPLVVTPHAGVVVPRGEPMRLAQAFEQLLNNRKQLPEMGRAAREHVALHYSPAAWLDQLLTLYSEVCVVDQRVLPLSEAN
jgi:glycosyltransferase involved in cell wall biosynthesis